MLVRARANRPLQSYFSNFHWGIQFSIEDFSILHWGIFSTPLSPSYEEGVLTPVPKPYAPTIGARDVAGYAIASPEFWYRQRSLCPTGWRWFPTQQSCDCFTPNRRFLCGVTPPPCWASALQQAFVKAVQQALIKAVYTAQIIATLLRKKIKARALTPRLP